MGPTAAKTARQLHSWGTQVELAGEFETASALSQLSTANSKLGYRSECLMLALSRFEELDILSIKASDLGDSPAHSPQFQELVDVFTHAMAKLNIDWSTEKWDVLNKKE